MNTKLSNKIKSILKLKEFNLEHESKMAQARILSSILEVVDNKKLTQVELEELTGLKQSFLSGLFNQNRNLSMKHIALLQNALGIVLQPPSYLTVDNHEEKFYSEIDYKPAYRCFPDMEYLKEEIFITWINPLEENDKEELKHYNTVNTKTLNSLEIGKDYEIHSNEFELF